jgi:hypothetical protein
MEVDDMMAKARAVHIENEDTMVYKQIQQYSLTRVARLPLHRCGPSALSKRLRPGGLEEPSSAISPPLFHFQNRISPAYSLHQAPSSGSLSPHALVLHR